MVTQPGRNPDIQIARLSVIEDLTFANWLGTTLELGGRGGVVQLWGIHHYCGADSILTGGAAIWVSCLSSNPDHIGEQALGLDDVFQSPAIYGTHLEYERWNSLPSGGIRQHETRVIPLYGIIRPRRQVWVLFIVDWIGSHRFGIEVYYSEIEATEKQEAQVNYKYGKYRRGR